MIDGTPQVMPHGMNIEEHIIEMAFVAGPRW
jgi:hypothetical protein